MILISGEALIDLIPDPIRIERLRRRARRLALQCRDRAEPPRRADGFRFAPFGRRQRRGSCGRASRERRRSWLRRPRHAPDDARLRHARHRQDRLALFVLSRRDGLRRTVAVSGRMAERRRITCMSARSPPSTPAMAQSVIAALAAARPHATISFDPNIRPLVTPDRETGRARWSSARFRSRIWSRRARKTSNGSIQAAAIEESLAAWAKLRPAILCRDAGRARRARHARQGAYRGSGAARRGRRHRRRRRQLHVGAALGDGPRPGARRRGAGAVAKRTRTWLRFAAAASAITCTRKGSDPPTRAEVEAALAAMSWKSCDVESLSKRAKAAGVAGVNRRGLKSQVEQ